MLDELIAHARMVEKDRTHQPMMARTLAELYGPCQCRQHPARVAPTGTFHTAQPGLFQRLVWTRLGS